LAEEKEWVEKMVAFTRMSGIRGKGCVPKRGGRLGRAEAQAREKNRGRNSCHVTSKGIRKYSPREPAGRTRGEMESKKRAEGGARYKRNQRKRGILSRRWWSEAETGPALPAPPIPVTGGISEREKKNGPEKKK